MSVSQHNVVDALMMGFLSTTIYDHAPLRRLGLSATTLY
ncbi:hypothetical protein LCGC14_2005970, partial [marine sediment metagenome]